MYFLESCNDNSFWDSHINSIIYCFSDTDPKWCFFFTLIILYEEKVITEEEEQLVSEILQDKIEDLYNYLVEKLAADIQKELGGLKYMFLFDAYDLGKSNYKFDWLKLFINSHNLILLFK